MPTAASAALRAAVHDALVADGALTALLGGPKVYDEPPRGAAFPYVTLGEARVADFSDRHRAGRGAPDSRCTPGRARAATREAHLIAGALLQALDDAPLDARRSPAGQLPLRGRRRAPRGRRPHLSRAGALSRGD